MNHTRKVYSANKGWGDIHGKVQLILLGGIEIENNCRHQQVTGNFVDLISNRLMGNKEW